MLLFGLVRVVDLFLTVCFYLFDVFDFDFFDCFRPFLTFQFDFDCFWLFFNQGFWPYHMRDLYNSSAIENASVGKLKHLVPVVASFLGGCWTCWPRKQRLDVINRHQRWPPVRNQTSDEFHDEILSARRSHQSSLRTQSKYHASGESCQQARSGIILRTLTQHRRNRQVYSRSNIRICIEHMSSRK